MTTMTDSPVALTELWCGPDRSRHSQWLLDLQEKASARFAELGLPTLRDEEWRFISLKPIAETKFRAPGEAPKVSADRIDAVAYPGLTGPRLVYINGRYAPELSNLQGFPKDVTVTTWGPDSSGDLDALVREHLGRYADAQDKAFTALNTALLEEVTVVHVPRGVQLEAPIWVVHYATTPETPIATNPRTLVIAGASSQVTVVEDFVGAADDDVYLTNSVTEVAVAENADVRHYLIERESRSAFNISSLHVHQARDSRFVSHSVLLGGSIVRNDVHPVLDGENCYSVLNGLYVGREGQRLDNHMRVEHRKPHCESRQHYNGILGDDAHGVFTGRIVVSQIAQKTDAVQHNANLLLSPNARANTKPQLEIYADDVKCTHGATIGQLDDEAIFYLRSRGMSEAAARGTLVYAFASEGLARMELEPVRTALAATLMERLPQSHTLETIFA